MAYFNHAFQKTLINTNGFYTTAGNPTSVLASNPAKVAVVNAATNTTINIGAAAPTIQSVPMIYLAQGTINTLDKLGPFAGGYQESVKTKGINPKYVSKFFRVDPACPQAEIVKVNMCDWPTIAPQCGTSYYLRLDVKGSPALRFLSHNLYKVYGSSNVCCPVDPTASTDIDPMQVFASWAWQIARDPLMSQFVDPTITWTQGGSSSFNVTGWYAANPTLLDTDLYAALGSAGTYLTGNAWNSSTSTNPAIVITGAYVDTQFGTCSFHPQDFYELAPVKLYPSITDQMGDPCVNQIFCPTDGVTVPKTQLGVQGSGYGYKQLRDVILFRRYMQEQYVYDPRLREVMNQDQAYNYITGSDFYTTYGLLHSVPRFNNPTGTFDNDQYLITIIMPSSACGGSEADTDFETWMNDYLANAGNGVQLEVIP